MNVFRHVILQYLVAGFKFVSLTLCINCEAESLNQVEVPLVCIVRSPVPYSTVLLGVDSPVLQTTNISLIASKRKNK